MTVLHSTLTGSDLHECKGADSATAGQVPVATGAGTAVFATITYSQISGTPSLAAVATSGAYSDLSGKPVLAAVATSGAYSDLTGKPTLATVATSGSYADLSNKPLVPTLTLNGTVATSTPLIKTYTTTAAAGLWSVTLSGFTTIHNVIATAINPGSTAATTAVAGVATFSTTTVTGTVVLLDNPPVLGTTQAVRVTVFGV